MAVNAARRYSCIGCSVTGFLVSDKIGVPHPLLPVFWNLEDSPMRSLLLTVSVAVLFASVASAQAQKWTQAAPTNSPGPWWSHATAHDHVRGRTVIFGGDPSFLPSDFTWEYDGATWTQMSPATKPPMRRMANMVFDSKRQVVVLFGGNQNSRFFNDTWEYDGTDWKQVVTPTLPDRRAQFGMVYDEVRERVVMFGGSTFRAKFNDTWEYDGTDWTYINPPTSPPANNIVSMAYDVSRQVVVMFGGVNFSTAVRGYSDTWEYDGSNWTKANPATVPPARYAHGMAYDLDRKRTVMFGGQPNEQNDTWEYDGTNWSLVSTPVGPVGRWDFDMMVYDRNRARMVIFGGTNITSTLGDTWEYMTDLPAQCVFRNGTGVNPTGYACVTKPALGTVWQSTIPTPAGTAGTFLGLAGAPAPGIPFLGYEVLIQFSPAIFLSGLGSFSVPIPNQAPLLGVVLPTQAFRLDSTGFVMLNALDLTLGN